MLAGGAALRVSAPSPFAPRVHVRWAQDISDAQRTQTEHRHDLANGRRREGTTWEYDLVERSPSAVRTLLDDPTVADTHYIDRGTAQVTAGAPVGTTRARLQGTAGWIHSALFGWFMLFCVSAVLILGLWQTRAATRIELRAAGTTAAITLYFIGSGVDLSETSAFLPTYRYVVNDALLAAAAIALTLFAFNRATRHARVGGASLFLASAAVIIAIADVYTLALRFDRFVLFWGSAVLLLGVWRMRAAARMELWAAGTAAAITLYFIRFGVSLSETSTFLPTYRYIVNDALLAIAAIALTLFAFCRARRHARWGGASLFLASTALIVAVADVYILAFRFDTSGPGWNLVLTHTRWLSTFVQTNEAGFWERPLAPYRHLSADDRYIIAAVGDSFTFGQGVLGAEYRFTNRLHRSLQDAFGSRVEVLNFGMSAGNTRQEARWIRESVAQVRPDMVIVFYLSNDIQPIEGSDAGVRMRDGMPTRLLLASPIFNYAYWYLFGPLVYGTAGSAQTRNFQLAYRDEERMRQHLNDIDALIDAIRGIGARPALVILPFPHMWAGVNQDVQEQIYARIAGHAQRQGALVLNLAPLEAELPPARFQVNHMDGHPNADAHALIASRLHRWLSVQPEIRQYSSAHRPD